MAELGNSGEAEALGRYKDIPEEDRIKAKKFFDYGATVAGSGSGPPSSASAGSYTDTVLVTVEF